MATDRPHSQESEPIGPHRTGTQSGAGAADRKTPPEVSVDARDRLGRTPLFEALAPFGPALSGARSLIDAGADVNARTYAHESVVGYCYGGVCSNLERGLAYQFEEMARRAGFENRVDDAPWPGAPGVDEIQRTLAQLSADEVEFVERTLVREAADRWAQLVRAHGLENTFPGFGADLAGQAFDAAVRTREPAEVVEALVEPVARLLDKLGGLHASDTFRLALFAARNMLYRRLPLNEVGPPVALVVCQALHAVATDGTGRKVLEDVVMSALDACD